VHDVVDLGRAVLERLLLLLFGRVRAWAMVSLGGSRMGGSGKTNVDVALLDDHHLTVDLVNDVVDQLAAAADQCPRQLPAGRETCIGKASENISSSVRTSL
jgi:hypothetical protein